MVTITKTAYHTNGTRLTTRDWIQVTDHQYALDLLGRMQGDYAESPDLIAIRKNNTLYVAGVRPDGTRYKMSTYRIEDPTA